MRWGERGHPALLGSSEAHGRRQAGVASRGVGSLQAVTVSLYAGLEGVEKGVCPLSRDGEGSDQGGRSFACGLSASTQGPGRGGEGVGSSS